MYCILVTGIPAAGKSTMAQYLSLRLKLPMVSKDRIKELLFDQVGFGSRAEKVRLGAASTEILYYFAERLMACGKPFILENNFEYISREKLLSLLERYGYTAVTVMLTGDYRIIYQRFLERNFTPQRHRGHVVNDRYPEETPDRPVPAISYESFAGGITKRGMDSFTANGPQLTVDTTDFGKVDLEALAQEILSYIDALTR